MLKQIVDLHYPNSQPVRKGAYEKKSGKILTSSENRRQLEEKERIKAEKVAKKERKKLERERRKKEKMEDKRRKFNKGINEIKR